MMSTKGFTIIKSLGQLDQLERDYPCPDKTHLDIEGIQINRHNETHKLVVMLPWGKRPRYREVEGDRVFVRRQLEALRSVIADSDEALDFRALYFAY